MVTLPEIHGYTPRKKSPTGCGGTHPQVLATGRLEQEDCLSSGILGCRMLRGSGIHTNFGINTLIDPRRR